MGGDIVGFGAATWLRGVPIVQVPTTLAAMVDASIGGKVAVNLPQAKNLVGAFYQPKAVLADVQALSTLGKRELSEGWAEAIKHGLILDPGLVDVFEEHAEALMEVEPEISTEVIRRSMAIKANIVSPIFYVKRYYKNTPSYINRKGYFKNHLINLNYLMSISLEVLTTPLIFNCAK